MSTTQQLLEELYDQVMQKALPEYASLFQTQGTIGKPKKIVQLRPRIRTCVVTSLKLLIDNANTTLPRKELTRQQTCNLEKLAQRMSIQPRTAERLMSITQEVLCSYPTLDLQSGENSYHLRFHANEISITQSTYTTT